MIKLVVNDDETIEIDVDKYEGEELYSLSMSLIEEYLRAIIESQPKEHRKAICTSIQLGLGFVGTRIAIDDEEEEKPKWKIIKGGKS